MKRKHYSRWACLQSQARTQTLKPEWFQTKLGLGPQLPYPDNICIMLICILYTSNI